MIGIDERSKLHYEGDGFFGWALWPSQPILSIATVARVDSDYETIPVRTDLGHAKLLFREDYFDPVTRVRRGRFYTRNDSQPHEWLVPPHPALPDERRQAGQDARLRKRLYSFHDWPARTQISEKAPYATIVLGVKQAATLWRVIAIEQISTGEDLVTLKSRSNMGVLPELSDEKVPSAHRQRVWECIDRLVDTAYRGGPEGVIDRSRDLATATLGALLEEPAKDLSDLAKLAAKQDRLLLSSAARILCLLHSRAKPAEQFKRSVLHPTEDDAALSLECAASILREVGWTTHRRPALAVNE